MLSAPQLLNDYTRLTSSKDLDPLINKIGTSRYVLLGEASHGTHEYYTWRTAISKRLIQEKDFTFIAVEGDWPDCYKINQYVKGYSNAGSSALEVLKELKVGPHGCGPTGRLLHSWNGCVSSTRQDLEIKK